MYVSNCLHGKYMNPLSWYSKNLDLSFVFKFCSNLILANDAFRKFVLSQFKEWPNSFTKLFFVEAAWSQFINRYISYQLHIRFFLSIFVVNLFLHYFCGVDASFESGRGSSSA